MNRFLLVGLVGVWGLWLVAVTANPQLVGWAFIACDVLLGLGLLALKVESSDTMQKVVRWMGWGFLAMALADLWWTLAFPSGEAKLGDTLGTWPAYAFGTGFYVYAAQVLHRYIRSLLGLSSGWLWGALAMGLTVALGSYGAGLSDQARHTPADSLAHFLNSVLAGVGAFAAGLFTLMGTVTRGGSISRWVAPVSLGSGLVLVGDFLYSWLGQAYRFGSLADWFYMVGTSMFFLYFVKAPLGRRVTGQPPLQNKAQQR